MKFLNFVSLFLMVTVISKVSSQAIGVSCDCLRRCSDGNFDEVVDCQPSFPPVCCEYPQFLSRRQICVDVNSCLQENVDFLISSQRPILPTPSVVEGTSNRVECIGNRTLVPDATCDIFCGQRFNPPPCTVAPRQDCACPDGTFANDFTGICVLPSQCPPGPTPTPSTSTTTRTTDFPVGITDPFVVEGEGDGSCFDPAVIARCDECERTCANRLRNVLCSPNLCPESCRCQDSTLRFQGRCVYVDECPREGADPSFCDGRCQPGQVCLPESGEFVCV